jgi:uncharacterized membrane protein YbaN (DUF454 family)
MRNYLKNSYLRKAFLIAAGLLSLAIGTIGVFIPLLPTTPFLLLSAACFIRSSDRLYYWLINHRIFGNYIRNYRENRALSRFSKIVTLLILWGTISYTAFFAIPKLPVQLLLITIALGVTFHVLSLKTIRKDDPLK